MWRELNFLGYKKVTPITTNSGNVEFHAFFILIKLKLTNKYMRKVLNVFANFTYKIAVVILLAFTLLLAYPLNGQRKKEGTQTQNKQTKQYRYRCKICGGDIVSYNKETIDNHKKFCRAKNKKNNATKKKKK